MWKEKLTQFRQYLILNDIKPDNYLSIIKTIGKILQWDFSQEKITDMFVNFDKSIETYNMYIKALKKWSDCFNLNLQLPKIKRVERKLPQFIELEYIEKEIIPRLPYIFGKDLALKVKAILLFLFYTGVRKSELITLKRNKINLLQRKAYIYEVKKKRERIVFFPEKVAEVLVEYFKSEEEKLNAFNLTKERLAYIFRKLKENFPEIKEALHPHSLRHSFAVHCIRKGIPISVLKDMLGHSTIKTTLRYVQVDEKMMEEFYRKYIR